MKEFFDLIYGDQVNNVLIMTRDLETGDLTSSRAFAWPKWKEKVVKFCEMRTDEDVYCTVATFPGEQRRKEIAGATAQVIWADADTCHPDNFRLAPSIIVETSPGHWHCWWVLDKPVDAYEASLLAQKVSVAHRDQGCDNGWSHTKILRVPGTSNLKRGAPAPVTAEYTGTLYTFEEFQKAYEDVEVVAVENMAEVGVPDPLSLMQRAALEDKYIRGQTFENLYAEDPPEGASWWPRLAKLQHELFRAGLQPAEVFDLCKHSRCDKFAREGRPETDLWKTVLKAYQEYAVTPEGEVSDSGGSGLIAPIPQFVTPQEESKLGECFIDQYTKYVATRTDSEPQFQRTLSIMLLSAIFSDRGYIPQKYAFEKKRGLNMWALIVAPTTTRKSTAKNIFLEVLHGYENNALNGQKIDIGSDTTKEALSTALGERDGLVSLIQTDEVAQAFAEAYGKNYKAGLLGFYTELFDGSVPVSLRVTKGSGQEKRATTKFLFLGLGIDVGNQGVAGILTKADFETGFLPRAVWTTAKERVRVKGSDYRTYDFGDTSYDETVDAMLDTTRLVMDLKKRTSKFNPDKPSAVVFSEAANRRFSDWADTLSDHAASLGEQPLLACADRLKESVEKTASLLAMYDGETVVSLTHMLHALKMAQMWYTDLLHMYQQVSASGFAKQCDDVEKYIGSGSNGERPETEVRRKFPLRPQEIGDILQSLVVQGRIRRNGTKYQVLAV